MTLESEQDRSRAIAAAIAGDVDAFAFIIATYNGPMYRVCAAVVRDPAIADEAVRRAWLSAWQKLSKNRDPARLRAWLMSLAVDEALEMLRAQGGSSGSAGAASSGTFAPGTVIGSVDVRVALERLDPDDRAPLAMRYIAGFDEKELAIALHMSESKVKTGMAQLLETIAGELGDG